MLSGVLFVLSVIDSVAPSVVVAVAVAVVVAVGGAVFVDVVAVSGGVVAGGGGVSFFVSVAELLYLLLGGFLEFLEGAFAGISF